VNLINFLLIMVLFISLYTDMVERKIYNQVTIPAAAAGLLINSVFGGVQGIKISALGLLLGMGVFLIPFIMGGIAAGDVKLLGAIGALKGPGFVIQAALLSTVIGGIIALAILFIRGELLNTLKNLFFRLSMANFHGEHREIGGAFPYGAAIFLGTIITLAARWYNLWLL
jgi:prepilin peptidase CpaA